MSKQVPEKKEAGLEQLAEILGFEKFSRMRGKLEHFIPLFEEIFGYDKEMPFSCKTPSELERKLNGVLGSEVLANLRKVFQLRKTGYEDFADEVLRALTLKNYLLPGESIDSMQLVPFTAFMVAPQQSMAVLKWIMTESHSLSAEEYKVRERDPEKYPFTADLYRALPELSSIICKLEEAWQGKGEPGTNGYEWFRDGYPVRVAYCDDVTKSYRSLFARLSEKGISAQSVPIANMCSTSSLGPHFCFRNIFDKDYLRVSSPSFSCIYEDLYGGRFKFKAEEWVWDSDKLLYIVQAEQSDVLSCLQESQEVATWQFKIPKFLMEKEEWRSTNFTIGLHSESNTEWKCKWPHFVSKGVCQGMQGFFIPNTSTSKHYLYKELFRDYKFEDGPFGKQGKKVDANKILFSNHDLLD